MHNPNTKTTLYLDSKAQGMLLQNSLNIIITVTLAPAKLEASMIAK